MRNYLFNQYSWFSVEQSQTKAMLEKIDSVDADRFLNTSVTDLCDCLEKEYSLDVPVINADDIVAEQGEKKIDVSGDPLRFYFGPGPHYATGTQITISIPFAGDPEMFKVQPSTSVAVLVSEIKGNFLIVRFAGMELSADEVKRTVNQTLSAVDENLKVMRREVDGFNSRLRTIASEAIERRRSKLLKDKGLVNALGFKIKERGDATNTYVAPEVRRKLTPSLPPASSSKYKPEPVLGDLEYEHILKVLSNMVHVMERSPSAFVSMDEEGIRNHFLVQLNGHYEGQATGETFNYQGKTDILIRSGDRNIFIAECKFWQGPRKLLETIDQVLGYSSWRDTKVAVIVFNRNKDFSNILAGIRNAVGKHSNFKKEIPGSTETIFRYLFSHRDDRNREMYLSILAFDVPS